MKATLWDKRSKKYDDEIISHDAIYVKTIDATKSLLGDWDIVLDIGCASGEMSLEIAPNVKRIHGIDLSVKMIELANNKTRKRRVDNIDFDQFDAFDQSLASNSFSAIIAFNILHLLDDVPNALARLHDLLAPNGKLISQTPCLSERGWKFRAFVNLAQKLGVAPSILSFTIAELASLVSSGNFEILENEIWDERNAVQWIVARKL